MGINGPNYTFYASGCRSPLGGSMPSGSYAGNRAYWSTLGGGGGNTTISIKNYSTCGGAGFGAYTGMGMYGMPGMYGMSGYYGGGCCCGDGGLSEKSIYTAMGIGAGIGLLASPLGKPIMKGIGTGFKYLGMGLGWAGKQIGLGAAWCGKQLWNGAKWTATNVIVPAASWTYNTLLKPVGEGIWNGVKWCGKQIGNFFGWIGRGFRSEESS